MFVRTLNTIRRPLVLSVQCKLNVERNNLRFRIDVTSIFMLFSALYFCSQDHNTNISLSYPARMRNKKQSHSVAKKKILRWRELAPSKTFEHIRSFEHTPNLFTCTCYSDDSLPHVAISAVFLLPGPFWQPF